MGDVRHDGRQHQYRTLQRLLQYGAAGIAVVLEAGQFIEQFHIGGDGGVEGIATADVVADLLDRLVHLATQIALGIIELVTVERRGRALAHVFLHGLP